MKTEVQETDMENILEVHQLKKSFYKNKRAFAAVDGIDFRMKRGECLGLMGESGCGKSTVARMITRLVKPDSGQILLEGEEIGQLRRTLYQKVQMIFQMPRESFDPRHTLGDGIMESMRSQGMGKRQAKERMHRLLEMTGLEETYGSRYPHEVSGGQCQRAAIARALAVDPKILVCDEATSALDVTVQAQIMELLDHLKQEKNLTLLFICHDLALVQAFCDRVLVMEQGKIVESGTPDEVIRNPRQAYTRLLIESAF